LEDPSRNLVRERAADPADLAPVIDSLHSESKPDPESSWIVNRAPRLFGIQIEPADPIVAGTRISVTPSADDPDGDALTFRYRWTVNGRRTGSSGSTLETDRLRRGDTIQVWAVANDGEVDSDPVQSPSINLANAPPRIVSNPGETGVDGLFRYEVEAEDPDQDRSLRYRLENAPEGMTVEVLSGVITWRPRESQAGTHAVQVIVDDMRGGLGEQTFEVSVGFQDVPPPASPENPESLDHPPAESSLRMAPGQPGRAKR
jgi:hypothetical protein